MKAHKNGEAERLRYRLDKLTDRHEAKALAAAKRPLAAELARLCTAFGLPDTPSTAPAAAPAELVLLLAIAYHAAAVQLELLGDPDTAVNYYINASRLASSQTGSPDGSATETACRLQSVLVRSRDAAARSNPRAKAALSLAESVGGELRDMFKSHRLKLRDAFESFDADGDGVIIAVSETVILLALPHRLY